MLGIADCLMQRLQAVQNVAARLITGSSRRDHISQFSVSFISCLFVIELSLKIIGKEFPDLL